MATKAEKKATEAAKRQGAADGPVKKLIASNKKARHDYHIDDTWEAGIVLTGTEVKSLRDRGASLVDGYCYLDGGEVWMDAVHIAPYVKGTWTNHAASESCCCTSTRSPSSPGRPVRRATPWSRWRCTSTDPTRRW